MRFPKTAVLQANESCWPSCYNTKFITGIWFPGIKEFNPEKQNSINIHYQFPKVNQMFCYIKHCNHLFCPDFAKAIKYGCELKLQNKINLSSIDQYPMLSHTTKVLHWNRPPQPVSGNSVHNWSIYWSVV